MKGASLVTISALFFATYGIWSKLMLGTFGEYNQATVKAIILLSFIIPYAFVSKTFKKINKSDYIWFFIIASVGGLNQAPYYFGFEHLTVGSATLLFYSGLTPVSYTHLIGYIRSWNKKSIRVSLRFNNRSCTYYSGTCRGKSTFKNRWYVTHFVFI